MRVEKWRLIQKTLISGLIAAIIFDTRRAVWIGITMIGVVNTIELSEVYTAWRRYRREQEGQDPPELGR